MKETIQRILTDQAVITALTGVIVALCAYIISLFNRLKSSQEISREADEEKLRSIKRSGLRNEYLGIYNSNLFTDEQKYGMTRDIVRTYKKLNGNHYISTLDNDLEERVMGTTQPTTNIQEVENG